MYSLSISLYISKEIYREMGARAYRVLLFLHIAHFPPNNGNIGVLIEIVESFFFAFRPYSRVGYRMARRFAWLFAALQKPKIHYKRNFGELSGRFGLHERPRSAPGAPSSPYYRFSKFAVGMLLGCCWDALGASCGALGKPWVALGTSWGRRRPPGEPAGTEEPYFGQK